MIGVTRGVPADPWERSVPDVLMQQTSPYGTRRASLLRSESDVYLYVEDLVDAEPSTASVVWVANHRPAPPAAPSRHRRVRRRAWAPGGPGTRTAARHSIRTAHLVWFEEGDGVALVDDQGALAVVPGWAGRDDFYGYARYPGAAAPWPGS